MKLRPIDSELFRYRPHCFSAGSFSIEDSAKRKRVQLDAFCDLEIAQSQLIYPESKEIVPVEAGESRMRAN